MSAYCQLVGLSIHSVCDSVLFFALNAYTATKLRWITFDRVSYYLLVALDYILRFLYLYQHVRQTPGS